MPEVRNVPSKNVSSAPIVEQETSSWMKMISSTLLGDGVNTLWRTPATGDTHSATINSRTDSKHTMDQTPTFKIALVGGSGVGKTSILRRWLHRSYTSTYTPTIGMDVISMEYKYKEKHPVFLYIYDVSSTEVDNTQSALHWLLSEGLDGIFFVFNVHRVRSIAAIDKWRHTLAKYISAKEIPCVLLAHKADLIQKRIMSSDDIASYARAAGYRSWKWTVGKPAFGENDKHPAVMEALDKMVDWMWSDRETRVNVERPVGIFDVLRSDRSREDTEENRKRMNLPNQSLLRIPMKAITTMPREEVYLHPIQEPQADNNKEIVVEESEEKSEERELENESTGEITGDAEETVDPVTLPSTQPEVTPTVTTPNAGESLNDHDSWRFFAGSINRACAETILNGREEGTFLLRRKDEKTLVLSYVGSTQIHHAVIEFMNRKFHVGSAKTAEASFSTLSKCLRSVRKYAYRGLVFTGNVREPFAKTEGL